jgi:hypothetical protein
MSSELKCNICGYPDTVSYTEIDQETGKKKTLSHTVQCLGHSGVHAYHWNKAPGGGSNIRSLGYDDYHGGTVPVRKKRNAKPKRKKSTGQRAK